MSCNQCQRQVAPANFAVNNSLTTDTTATFSFDKFASNIEQYRIQWTTDVDSITGNPIFPVSTTTNSQVFYSAVNAGATETFTVTGLAPDTTYYFQVRSYWNAGFVGAFTYLNSSLWSNPVKVTPTIQNKLHAIHDLDELGPLTEFVALDCQSLAEFEEALNK